MQNNKDQVLSNNLFEKEVPVRILAFLETKGKEEERQEVIKILIPIIEYSRKEEGNITYTLNSSIDNPNHIMIDEVWSTKENFDKHYNSLQSNENRNKIKDLLAKPMEIRVFKQIKVTS